MDKNLGSPEKQAFSGVNSSKLKSQMLKAVLDFEFGYLNLSRI
jgi:hypothetical protein